MNIYLISYDITCNTRRRKIHKLLTEAALGLQMSVFLYSGKKDGLVTLLADIKCIADAKLDAIVCLTVAQEGYCTKLCGTGQQGFLLNHSSALLNKLPN
jgi:CRISPR-associated endonuclease Cas2